MRKGRPEVVAALVLLASLMVVPGATAQPSAGPSVDFVVSPSRLEIRALPGETVEFSVTVYNRSSEELILDTYVEDIEIPRGDLIVADELAFTASRWTTFINNAMVVSPNGQVEVTMRMEVPVATPSGGYHAFGFFQTRVDSGADTIEPSGRIGVTLLLEVAPGETQLDRAAQVTANRLRVIWKGPFDPVVTATTSVDNIGDAHVVTGGLHTYRSWPGAASIDAKIGPHTTLRGTRHTFETAWDAVPLFGKVTVTSELVYQAGPDELPFIVLQETVWIIPWHLFAALAVLLLVALLLVRRRRPAAERKSLKPAIQELT